MALLTAAPAATATTTAVASSTTALVPIVAAGAIYFTVSGLADVIPGPALAQFRPFESKRLRVCRPLCAQLHPYGSERLQIHTDHHSFGDTSPIITCRSRLSSVSAVCLAALNARCSAVQTLPRVEGQKTTTKVPAKVSETVKGPKLDDTGSTPPPFDRGGGGGGGGGGDSSGGWVLFFFLLVLSYLKDKEAKEEHELERVTYTRRRSPDSTS